MSSLTPSNKDVWVVGDIMLDAYIWGDSTRNSPEAPVPVVDVERREARLGGAGNVALNLKGLGLNPLLIGVVGNDLSGERIQQRLNHHQLSREGVLTIDGRKTSTKTRIIVADRHMARIDEEDASYLQDDVELQFQDHLESLFKKHQPAAVILQDYNKGLLSPSTIDHIIQICRSKNIYVAVDPKKENFFGYKGASLFKPNLKEVSGAYSADSDKVSRPELESHMLDLKAKLDLDEVVVTMGEQGILALERDTFSHFPAESIVVRDVSGAGDTVISTLVLGRMCGLTLDESVVLANLAAAQVCQIVGVASVELKPLKKQFQEVNSL